MAVDPQPVIDDPTGLAGNGTVWGLTWQRNFEAAINAAITSALSASGSAVVQTTTLTGTQNDFALTAGATLLRCNNATLLTLTGLSAGTDGQRLTIVSVGAGQVDLSNQAAGSVAANRIINPPTATISLSAGSGSARLEYDATTARWRVIQHEQGAWITPAFSAGAFTANGSMTWTVASGDVTGYKYRLSGRQLTVEVYLNSTTVGGTVSYILMVAIPGGFTVAGYAHVMILALDNNVQINGAYAEVTPSGTVINCYKANTVSNWTLSTDLTGLRFVITFEVQ